MSEAPDPRFVHLYDGHGRVSEFFGHEDSEHENGVGSAEDDSGG